MDKDIRIAILGGDARYIELIRQLQHVPNVQLFLVGYDQLEQSFTSSRQLDLNELEPKQLDAVILPITGTNQEGQITSTFSKETIQLSEDWMKQLKENTIIFTGISNDYLTGLAKKTNKQLIPLLNRDDVAIYNSIPTAEGTIMMAITNTDYTIHSSRVIVAGFGRVGHTVANKFAALGAKVSVAASSLHDLARITEMGLTAVPLHKLHAYAGRCDILINTIPAPVIKKDSISQLPSHALIFDLASEPGGTDFKYAEQRGIKAILAKSLPGVVAPKTAGKILAEVIKQILEEV